jgi:PPOX class probable F420-dependent enzyme
MDQGGLSSFDSLRGHKYCRLLTFRRNGVAVNTPVWFGLNDAKLYVQTETPSGKVKRIRNNPYVQVGPCDFRGRSLGPAIDARARMLPHAEEPAAEEVLRHHYGLGRCLYKLLVEPVSRLRGSGQVYLEIVPASRRTR